MSEKFFSADGEVVRSFWNISRSYKKSFYLSYLTSISAILLNTLVPYALGKAIGNLLIPGASNTIYLWLFILAGVGGVLTNWIGYVVYMRWQAQVQADLQARCLQMLLQRGTAFHNNQVSGKIVSDALDYPSGYGQIANMFFTQLLPFVFILLSGITIVSLSSPLLGLLIGLMTVVAVGSGVRFRSKMKPNRTLRIKRSKAVTAHFADTIVNIQSVKTFAREKDELRTHALLSDKFKQSRMHDWVKFSVSGTRRIAAVLCFQFAFIVLLTYLVHRDPHLLGAGIFAFSYTMALSGRLFEVINILRTIDEAMILAEPMALAMRDEVEVQDSADATDLKVETGGVTFKDVDFHYSDSSKKQAVFSQLNVSIQPGEKVGLVGPSGGGKSTITKLLLRFEDVQSGEILIDGQNIADVTQTSLRQAIAYVPQESLLFHRTIAENIAYGALGADEEMIKNAAKAASAHDFIKRLPDGYKTIVGERGVKLSGGQRQRIAIARAMLKDAPILLLDEATSALDSESEKLIQSALAELMKNRTAVVIAHRLSTIQKMDRIIVLDKGKIVEDGSHKELLKQNGLYAKLWEHQSGGFLET